MLLMQGKQHKKALTLCEQQGNLIAISIKPAHSVHFSEKKAGEK